MARFFINLVLYGMLFFLIHKFLPETFDLLVVWITHIFDFISNITLWLVDKVQLAFNAAK